MIRRLILLVLAALVVSLPAQADTLGLYFSAVEFSAETASATVEPGFVLVAYIVLTDAGAGVIDGYEVAIACTAADFAIPFTNLTFDTNDGTNTNQIVTFMTPKPVQAAGTVLTTVFVSTSSTDIETISFGAATPSSLPGAAPVVRYGDGSLVACDLPFGSENVAWLNGEVVAGEPATWSGVKAAFR
jgi:hypothetical protein